tara:strand:+ start:366 stop:557 length:192 start_codon:yes stop_codon:yes gene_type:complete
VLEWQIGTRRLEDAQPQEIVHRPIAPEIVSPLVPYHWPEKAVVAGAEFRIGQSTEADRQHGNP